MSFPKSKKYFLLVIVGILSYSSAIGAYCSGNWSSAGSWSVSNVTIGNINNNTGWSANGYGNYTAQTSGSMPRGSATAMSVTISTPNFATLAMRVYFDWNNDGDFTDAGESVYNFSGNNQPATVNLNFNVTPPAATAISDVRFRVICYFNTSVLPDESSCTCSGCQAGEAEDYTANITSGLPIELTYFSAKKAGNKLVKLDWSTATEINNNYFTIERSTENNRFYSLATIRGAGNSTQNLMYTFYDEKPLGGWNYYRLRQTDYDGKSTVSQNQAIFFKDTDSCIINLNANTLSVALP